MKLTEINRGFARASVIPALLALLCMPAFADIVIFNDEMNSGSLNPKININAVGAITQTLSYVSSGGVAGPVSGIAGGYTQYAVDSTGATGPWFAGFGYYGAAGIDSPIHYTIPGNVPLNDISLTFDGKASGGSPLNVGVRLEAWDQNNTQELGVFYLLPVTITTSFQQIGGTLNNFQFFSSDFTADQAKDMATDWRFNFSFAGTAVGPDSVDDAAVTYGNDADNVLGMDNVDFRLQDASDLPEPNLLPGIFVCGGIMLLWRVRTTLQR